MNRPVFLLKSNLAQLGGAEKMALRLAKAFQSRNHPVTILTTGEISSLSDSPTQIISASHLPKLSVLKVRAFDRFCMEKLKQRGSAIVFGLDRNQFQTHIRASNGVHAAYLERRSIHEGFMKALSFKLNPLHHLLLKLEKAGFEHPELEKLYTNSAMVKAEILRFYNVLPKKIHVVHNGVEWKEMEQDFNDWVSKREEIFSTLKLNPNCFHFLFIGNNYQRKGLEPLLRALALLPSKEFHLSVVGKEKNCAHFVHLVHSLKLDKHVSFFGPQKKIVPFYQVADALVIPSFYDPFANVTVEALAMGVFVVSSKANGGHEVLTADTGAIIEDLMVPEVMAVALQRAMTRPKTVESANAIRQSVKALDFSEQMTHFLEDI
jgi:UDP-glucose:(heptosyl)LPS alpha-1,3-glucosyltransferase